MVAVFIVGLLALDDLGTPPRQLGEQRQERTVVRLHSASRLGRLGLLGRRAFM